MVEVLQNLDPLIVMEILWVLCHAGDACSKTESIEAEKGQLEDQEPINSLSHNVWEHCESWKEGQIHLVMINKWCMG